MVCDGRVVRVLDVLPLFGEVRLDAGGRVALLFGLFGFIRVNSGLFGLLVFGLFGLFGLLDDSGYCVIRVIVLFGLFS